MRFLCELPDLTTQLLYNPFTIFVCRLESVADLNNDCKVNLSDFVVMAAEWTRNGDPLDAGLTEIFGEIPQGMITVDGSLSDWTETVWQRLDVVYWRMPTDVPSARFALKWNEAVQKVYVVVEVTDSDHVFSDSYDSWDTSDRLEIYCQGNPVGGMGYVGAYDIAQQYYVAPGTMNNSWATWALGEAIAADTGFQYVTKVTGDKIVYEAAVSIFENYGGFNGTPTGVKTLTTGTEIGFDVVVCTRHVDGFGMLSGNALKNKSADASKFVHYRLR